MTITRLIVSTLVLALSFGASRLAADPPEVVDPAHEISQIPPLPHTPAAVNGLLYARPFTLTSGYEFEWRAEKPTVTAGWLLVLQVDTALVFPRQTAEPILYVGNNTAERVNIGHESGRTVVIVPSELNDKGEVALDLGEALMWFGWPGLPEQVDAGMIVAARQSAVSAKIAPFAKSVVDAARAKTDGLLQTQDRTSLRHAAAKLIEEYSPQEAELIESILAEQSPKVQPAQSNQ